MPKLTYHYILCIGFTFVFLQFIIEAIPAMSFLGRISILKPIPTLMFLIITIVETATSKQIVFQVSGIFFMLILIFGILEKVMHWPFANETMLGGGFMTLAILLLLAILNKKKQVLPYLFVGFAGMWFFHFLHWGGIVTWWGELGFSLAIFIAAALKIPALRKQAAEASKVRLAEARKELEEMDF